MVIMDEVVKWCQGSHSVPNYFISCLPTQLLETFIFKLDSLPVIYRQALVSLACITNGCGTHHHRRRGSHGASGSDGAGEMFRGIKKQYIRIYSSESKFMNTIDSQNTRDWFSEITYISTVKLKQNWQIFKWDTRCRNWSKLLLFNILLTRLNRLKISFRIQKSKNSNGCDKCGSGAEWSSSRQTLLGAVYA